jgi:hypothetical protein
MTYHARRHMEGELLSRCMGDPDAVFAAEQICRNAPDLRETRHIVIGDCPRWLDTLAKSFIIAAGIVSVALWVAFR